ncbi:MAG: NFACT family protein [Clostridia bacterium]|nr:NFACT family protein [Clostridia bacterium]
MAFDGIVTKKVVDELQNLINYKIDKIYQPNKNTIVLGLYGNFTNIALLACISSNNYRIHITTKNIKNPQIAPSFCMLLRKHILGYKVKKIYTKALERIVFIDLENSENPNKTQNKTLVIELMSKHSNIILLDKNGIIIESIRHTSTEEKAQRDIYPTARYFEPIKNKLNFLEVKNFEEFYLNLKLEDEGDILEAISQKYNGISFINLIEVMKQFENKNDYSSNKAIAHKSYDVITDILNRKHLEIKKISKKNGISKDYCLSLNVKSNKSFSLNFSLDDFYFEKENNETFTDYRNTLLNLILSILKKYEKRLVNIDEKLTECNNMDKYKLYGELITANLYKIPNYNIDKISLENYYNNNELIEIPLDKKYSPQYNAKRFFKKYSKLKNASEIVDKQKKETIEEINYIESTIYELENCKNNDDVQEVYNEIVENEIFQSYFEKKKTKLKKNKKPSKKTSNKFSKFNPIKYIIEEYTIYVGRNNKENDYLTNKFARKDDLWFHTKDIHGSHVILKTNPNEKIPESIIYDAAKLAVEHSKAKNSSNVPVDYCKVCYVKRIPGNKPGLVIYTNNKTIYI